MDITGIDLKLRVDRQLHPIDAIGVLSQADPFPGDRRFHLSIVGPDAERLLVGQEYFVGPVDPGLSRAILMTLNLDALQMERRTTDVLLNRVEELEYAPGVVRMSGTASSVVPSAAA